MTESHDLVHDIEDHRMLKHSVVIELSQVLDFGDPALIKLEVVLLETERDGLDHGVDDANHKPGMVAVKGAQQNRQEVDVAIFDLSWLREDLVKNGNDLA
jgi:hypothetical protein